MDPDHPHGSGDPAIGDAAPPDDVPVGALSGGTSRQNGTPAAIGTLPDEIGRGRGDRIPADSRHGEPRRSSVDRVEGSRDPFLVPLQSKLFLAFLPLGLALFALGRSEGITWLVGSSPWAVWFLAGVTSILFGALLTYVAAGVARVPVLRRSALEIARGDLARSAETATRRARLPDEIDELAHSIVVMRESLRELVGHTQRTSRRVADSASGLGSTAAGVASSASEVAVSIDRIAVGAGEQDRLVGDASRIISRMAASIDHTASSAEEAARSSAETARAAAGGSDVARLAGAKVRKVFERIEAASDQVFAFGAKTHEIGQIVRAMTRIAQATKLLAINASIEAARAGEYGRGFAVVAEEVRLLAESSGRSAEQISGLAQEIDARSTSVIAAMREGIEELDEGRVDLDSILRALEEISRTSRQHVEKVASISEAAREQRRGSEEMVAAIRDIKGVAQANVRSSGEVASSIEEQTEAMKEMAGAAKELAHLAVELQTIVSRFRL